MADSSVSEKPKPGTESPITEREAAFVDEPQESGVITPGGTPLRNAGSPAPKRVSFQEDAPPAKPPRPLSPHVQAENTLIEAFPGIDAKVIKAVLIASGGKVEPAFNALLGMSDPDFKEEGPPPQPPRPTQTLRQSQQQLEADEMYARQLAEHYQSAARPQRGEYQSQFYDATPPPKPPRPRQGRAAQGAQNEERSFFDAYKPDISEDIPVIKENVRKGFLETQTKVNQWISNFKKRIDGDDDDPYNGPPRMDNPSNSTDRRQNFGPSQAEQLYGIRKGSDVGRKSNDRERYDADPHVLGDDFTALELRDEEGRPEDIRVSDNLRKSSQQSTATPPRQQTRSPGRPPANPDLFKHTPAPPQSGPVDEIDAMDRKHSSATSFNLAAKFAKWQPLTSVAPNPEMDDNDPFSLGDSDDEKDSKASDLRKEDSARLKEAARQSVSEEKGKTLEPNEQSGSLGTKDKEAEALLTGKP
ncbi:ubiquitin-binding protein cue5 [Elasticomyces elasticus]|nr:ubiquitin-binding protein cue5 [Elasticomyces elasticus]